MRIVGGNVCTPEGIRRDCDIVIKNGKLSLEPAIQNTSSDVVDATDRFILPGFIEIHTHGAGLFEFMKGRYDLKTRTFQQSEEIYQQELPRYAHIRSSTGVTNLYLGTAASPLENLQFCFKQLKNYIDSPGNGKDGTRIAGGLLEGAFFNPKMGGAQNIKFTTKPNMDYFERVNETGVIRLVNLVPDFGEISYQMTETLTKKGISVGAGHTDATYDQFKRSIDSGLKYGIHFLNGPISGSYKQFNGGGGIEAGLRNPIYAEMITDGIHIAPWYVLDVMNRKGEDRIMAISDAMFFSQSSGVREFDLNGICGRIDDTGRYVYVVGRERLTLYSSIVTMDTAFSNLISWLTVDIEGAWTKMHHKLSLDQAVPVAAKCCATNIANMLKWHGGDDLEAGEITNGKWADLVIGKITGQPGNFKLIVDQVYVRGQKVFDRTV